MFQLSNARVENKTFKREANSVKKGQSFMFKFRKTISEKTRKGKDGKPTTDAHPVFNFIFSDKLWDKLNLKEDSLGLKQVNDEIRDADGNVTQVNGVAFVVVPAEMATISRKKSKEGEKHKGFTNPILAEALDKAGVISLAKDGENQYLDLELAMSVDFNEKGEVIEGDKYPLYVIVASEKLKSEDGSEMEEDLEDAGDADDDIN